MEPIMTQMALEMEMATGATKTATEITVPGNNKTGSSQVNQQDAMEIITPFWNHSGNNAPQRNEMTASIAF